MKKMKKISLFTLLVFSTSAFSFAQKAVLDLNKATSFTYKSSSNTTINVEVMGQSQENVNTDEKTVTVNAKKENSVYKIEEKLTKLKVGVQGQGQDKTYDSDSKSNDEDLEETFASDLNKVKTFDLQMDGTITNTTVEEKKKNAEAEAAKNAIGNILNAGENDLPFLSKKLLSNDIAVNNTWADTASITKDKTTSKNTSNYKVLSVENNIATIEQISDIEVNGTMEQMGMEMTLVTKNKMKAVITLDINSGIIMEKNAVVEINGNVDAMGMTIPVTGKSIKMFKVNL
jgi:hypothetical protein